MQTTRTAPPTTIKVRIMKDPHNPGKWTIEPEDHSANNGRFGAVGALFFQRRDQRNPKKPFEHVPIVFNQGDTLTFSCTPPRAFEIGAKKDENVDAMPNTPADPFGWNGLQPVQEGGSKSGVVTTGAGVENQAFYKFYGFVMDNGSRVPVDPDGYCGS